MSKSAVDARSEALDRISVAVSALDAESPTGTLLGPRILLTTAGASANSERIINIGIATELLWRANLMHKHPLRSDPLDGAPSPTLLGDTMLAESFRLLAAHSDSRTVQILSVAMASASEGALCEDREATAQYQSAYHGAVARVGARESGLPEDGSRTQCELARAIGYAHLMGLEPPPGTDPFIAEGIAASHALDANLNENPS